MRYLLLIMLISGVVSFLLSFPVRKLGVKVLPTMIRERDVHSVPVPRIGGLAIGIGLIAGLCIAFHIPFFSQIYNSGFEIPAIIICTIALMIVGLVDDIWGVDWMLKLGFQIIIAAFASSCGIQIMSLPIAGLTISSGTVSMILTVIVMVSVINAINFIDGLDGLATGVTIIGASAFFYYAWDLSATTYNYAADATLLTAVLIGACLGFLPHNFNPAKTFMGDTGSQLLGFYIACASLLITGKIDPETVNIHSIPAFMPILLPFLVLLLPTIDITFAIIRRVVSGKSPFEADRKHIHHRMLEIGHSHRKSVLILYLWTCLFAFGGILFIYLRGRIAFFTIAVFAVIVTLITFAPKLIVPKIFDDLEPVEDAKKAEINKRLFFGTDDSKTPFIHIDMDAFFASCEIVKNPELKGKPVIIGQNNNSVVSAASYEAREFGVHSAMPVFQAKKLCPEGVFLPVDMAYYQEVSKKVIEIIKKFVYKVEQISVDEAVIDAKPAEKLFGSPLEVANLIKNEINDVLGVNASCGIAKNRSIAKIASNYAKPNGILLIPYEKSDEFLDPLEIKSIWGIGKKTNSILKNLGIEYIKDLKRIDQKTIINALGEKIGTNIYLLANGIDNRDVITKISNPKSIGREITLETATKDINELSYILKHFTDILTSELRRSNLGAKHISLILKDRNHIRYSRLHTFDEYIYSQIIAYKTSFELLKRFLQENPILVRLIGISFSGLENIDSATEKKTTLFDNENYEYERIQKIDETVDKIRKKYGTKSIKRA